MWYVTGQCPERLSATGVIGDNGNNAGINYQRRTLKGIGGQKKTAPGRTGKTPRNVAAFCAASAITVVRFFCISV